MTNDTRDANPARRDDQTAFARSVDAFGGDIRRWPGADRLTISSLPARDPLARRQLAEARALDDVLALSTTTADRHRLMQLEDLIVAAAVAERGAAHASAGNVVPMRSAVPDQASLDQARDASEHGAANAPSADRQWRHRSDWRAAAVLAASLFAGVFIGISEPGQTTVGNVIAAVEQQPAWDSSDIVAAIQSDVLDLEDTP